MGVPGLTVVVRGATALEVTLTGRDPNTIGPSYASCWPWHISMIGLTSGRPILLATGVTDLGWGVTRLYALILEQLRQEPLSGAIFAFGNRRRDTVKLFCYDTGGVWLCAKRLEQGTFRSPALIGQKLQNHSVS